MLRSSALLYRCVQETFLTDLQAGFPRKAPVVDRRKSIEGVVNVFKESTVSFSKRERLLSAMTFFSRCSTSELSRPHWCYWVQAKVLNLYFQTRTSPPSRGRRKSETYKIRRILSAFTWFSWNFDATSWVWTVAFFFVCIHLSNSRFLRYLEK